MASRPRDTLPFSAHEPSIFGKLVHSVFLNNLNYSGNFSKSLSTEAKFLLKANLSAPLQVQRYTTRFLRICDEINLP